MFCGKRLALWCLFLVQSSKVLSGEVSLCFGQDQFLLIEVLVDFEGAKAACSERGGMVARISSVLENAFATLVANNRSDLQRSVWIGMLNPFLI